MRIALVIERFVAGAGGVENVAWQVAHELARQGESVTVLARDFGPSSKATRSPEPPLVEHVHIPVPRAWQPARVLLFSRAVSRRIARADFDVVHSFARTHDQDLYRAGGGRHADYMRRSHTGPALAIRSLSPRHCALLSLEKRVFAHPTQRIQCASRLVANAFIDDEGVDPERIFLLPNAVDAEHFSDPAAFDRGRQLRHERDPSARRVWLLPGSGWRRKGLTTAFEALARLADPSIHLWIAGRDPIRPWQSRAAGLGIGDACHFLGECKDMAAVYAAADGVLLPTRYDPFANVTIEAAAAGRPIITTAANGASEWFDESLRVLSRANDAEALSAAMVELDDRDRARACGLALEKQARSLDWSSHVEALKAEYARICEARARAAVR